MSARKLLIPIDAEDKYCGKCWILPSLKKICGSKYCHGQLLLYNYEVDDYLRCPACLDAEVKTDKQIHKELSDMVDRSNRIPLKNYISANEVMKKLDDAEVKE